MSVISEHVFEMISDPHGINLSLQANPRLFNKVYLRDTLLNFYPYGEIFLNDKQGIILSAYTFIEGMKFKTKLGFPEQTLEDGQEIGGYLTHTYGWSESQIPSTIRDSEYISGINCFLVISDFYFKDFIKPQAFKQQPSDIARAIAKDVYNITDPSMLFIDDTTNDLSNIWYQGNRTHRDFIERTLTRNATTSLTPNADKTPYVSFINCNGEFYFCSYAYLYSQTEVATYEMKLTLDRTLDPFVIQEIHFFATGAPFNKSLYNQEIHTLSDTGTATYITSNLENNYLKMDSSMSRYPVIYDNTKNVSSIKNFGLFEAGDVDSLKGRELFLYQNSCIAFRIEMIIIFNPRVVAGKVINLKIKKFTDNDDYSEELSGNWLVISSEHRMDQDAAIYSKITVARPSIPFGNQWPYLSSVLL